MAARLTNASETELRLAAELRARALQRVQREGLSKEDLAGRLGLLPAGAGLLLERDHWPLEVAVRVAEAVGVEVELKANPASA